MLNIRHSGIVVKNLEKALEFYIGILGLKYVNSNEEKGNYIGSLLGLDSLIWIKLKTDNGDLLELYCMAHYKKGEYQHVAFTVDNIAKMRRKLIKKDILCSPIKIDKQKKHKVLFCKDYENNLLEIVEEL